MEIEKEIQRFEELIQRFEEYELKEVEKHNIYWGKVSKVQDELEKVKCQQKYLWEELSDMRKLFEKYFFDKVGISTKLGEMR